VKINRLRIKSYRGIEDLDTTLAPAGAVVSGDNAKGKTSVLRAIRAALEAKDIAPDAIRLGADRAEILLDLDDLTVRRLITPSKSDLTVKQGRARFDAPVAMLRELLGGALDPMDLLTLKAKERRDKILAAMPVEVTIDQLRRWVPKLPESFDCSGHGLAVIERLHDTAYEKRSVANVAAKAARAEADRLAKDAPEQAMEAPDVEPFQNEYDALRTRVDTMNAQSTAATQAHDRTAGTRECIEELRWKAAKKREEFPPINAKIYDDLFRAITEGEAHIATLRETLKKAEDTLALQKSNLHMLDVRSKANRDANTQADSMDQQAKDLEQTLADASLPAPSTEEIGEATRMRDAAQEALAEAQSRVTRAATDKAAIAKAKAAEDDAKAKEAEAARLDGVVKALANDAPTELLAACNGIPGLTVRGDDVLLDGKSLNALSGAEQVRLCVAIARRANAKSKILLVDGLERIGPAHREVFLREATAEGWQILATLVSEGDLVIEAIQADETAEVMP